MDTGWFVELYSFISFARVLYNKKAEKSCHEHGMKVCFFCSSPYKKAFNYLLKA